MRYGSFAYDSVWQVPDSQVTSVRDIDAESSPESTTDEHLTQIIVIGVSSQYLSIQNHMTLFII
jgi:hypothetical protein